MKAYDPTLDNSGWFDSVKAVAQENGFCPDVKAYKLSPEGFKGHVGDVSSFIRVALTGKLNSPDLYTVMQILGKERSLARIDAYISTL
jgi:glutamyl-tRNA synthetase